MADIGRNIRKLRTENGYSQQYVAAQLGTSQTMYARYERNANELPVRHLVSIAKLYGVTTDSIVM